MMVRLAGPGDQELLERVADGVFDNAIKPAAARAFLLSDTHHLALAIDDGTVVGMASAAHHHHPDKAAPELWINEVGVADAVQGRGIGRQLIDALATHGRALGCSAMWVLTDRENTAACALYAGRGGIPASGETLMYEWDLTQG